MTFAHGKQTQRELDDPMEDQNDRKLKKLFGEKRTARRNNNGFKSQPRLGGYARMHSNIQTSARGNQNKFIKEQNSFSETKLIDDSLEDKRASTVTEINTNREETPAASQNTLI
jgi:hypothetical protein